MSSSNLVAVHYTAETEYGVPPVDLTAVTLETARFTSESLSGTPTTAESAAIRTDRMSGGQVAVGLEVGGGLDFELAPDQFFDDFFEAGMMSTWVAAATSAETVTLTPDGGDNQKATVTIGGDFSTIGPGVAVGDVLQLIPASGSPVVVQVISVDSTTELTVATKRDQAPIVAAAMTVAIPAHLVIGATKKSFLISKSYKDVPHLPPGTDLHSQRYSGELVSGFTVNAAYGEIVTGIFNTLGNGYLQEAPSYEQQVISAPGTVNPAGTSLPVNASIDVPLVTADGEATDFCIETFTINLDNGLTPQNCIGKVAPQDYSLGTARIALDANIYLSDTSYDAFMPAKLTQAPVSLLFTMTNTDGGYAFDLSAVQLSFPDPASEGQDAQTMINATGVGKVGDGGESAIKIYKLVGDQ